MRTPGSSIVFGVALLLAVACCSCGCLCKVVAINCTQGLWLFFLFLFLKFNLLDQFIIWIGPNNCENVPMKSYMQRDITSIPWGFSCPSQLRLRKGKKWNEEGKKGETILFFLFIYLRGLLMFHLPQYISKPLFYQALLRFCCCHLNS